MEPSAMGRAVGGSVASPEAMRDGFIDRWQSWLPAECPKPRTRKEYRLATLRVMRAMDRFQPAEIARSDVLRFIESGLKSKGRKSVANELMALRSFLSWAVKFELIQADPTAGININKSGQRAKQSMRPFTDAEATRLIAAAKIDSEAREPRWPQYAFRWVYYTLLQCTGVRRSEGSGLTAIRRCDLDLDSTPPVVTISPDVDKEGQAERIPLTHAAATALRWWLARTDLAPPESPIFPRQVHYDALHWDMKKAGVHRKHPTSGQGAGFHSFRHSLCLNLARAGVPINLAAKVTRHKDLNTLRRIYTQADDGDKFDAVAKAMGLGRENPVKILSASEADSVGIVPKSGEDGLADGRNRRQDIDAESCPMRADTIQPDRVLSPALSARTEASASDFQQSASGGAGFKHGQPHTTAAAAAHRGQPVSKCSRQDLNLSRVSDGNRTALELIETGNRLVAMGMSLLRGEGAAHGT